MAFSFNTRAFLVIIELLLVLFATTHGAPLDDICNQSLDKSFCLNDFGSNPVTRTADLHGLAQIAIDRALVNATRAESTIQTLIHSTTNSQLTTLLVQCDNSYVDALNALSRAPGNLYHGNYRDLSLHGGMISDAGSRCESSFGNSFKSPLTSENWSLRVLGDIINVIANGLIAGSQV